MCARVLNYAFFIVVALNNKSYPHRVMSFAPSYLTVFALEDVFANVPVQRVIYRSEVVHHFSAFVRNLLNDPVKCLLICHSCRVNSFLVPFQITMHKLKD